MLSNKLDSEFLKYLVDQNIPPGDRLPTLTEISKELGVSVGKLREQLEVARRLGLVSVRPRLGIQREPFSFAPAVLSAVIFSLGSGEANFVQFSRVRVALEMMFWDEAVALLTAEDLEALRIIIGRAWNKLRGEPVHVPNSEHRELHLKIFSRLNNPFVQGLLEAYWDAYEASELTRFASYQYWVTVWEYHERIVDALCSGDFETGRALLVQHFSLLPTSPQTA
ncbi:MAG: FadR family transcriptional regulator [Anaerolineales bacterium]|nr:FadR family transcriptional regulator [Anaerolineales bacterium]MCB8991696.1 FadR family transcriptional regulator [Ardenticatenaceae bacterium]MCB9005540.1 FadR family transcriptional regulator [Ardenticatenaceae bacterium]